MSSRRLFTRAWELLAVCVLIGLAVTALRADISQWTRNLEAGSALEQLFFRAMWMPYGSVAARRPPAETRPALDKLIAAAPTQADLYSLRALEDEQQLDFTTAESDWKKFAEFSTDKAAGQFGLADYYHRRLRPKDEIASLLAAGAMPSPSSEHFTPAAEQRAWSAFPRIFDLAAAHALPAEVSDGAYKAWIARYPREAYAYTRYFSFLLEQKDYPAATGLIAQYRKAFPDDEIFPVKARALIAYRSGSTEQGLAAYESQFKPLWPAELENNYFDLLRETHSLRKYLDQTRAAIATSPDDVSAAARLYYYYQQQGNLAAAQRALTDYRTRKESRHAGWTSEQLYTLGRLSEASHDYNEAARYYFALYSLPQADNASAERALGGLINILLTAPEQSINLGSGDLSFYKDVGTLDTGPGYLNGILSLLLNSTEPAQRYAEQESGSVSYFHRARASELLALFDRRFPRSSQRDSLHLKMTEVYANYGESDAVLRFGKEYLAAFPDSPHRTRVSLLMADAYAQKELTTEEFAVYDAVLKELADRAENMPLGAQDRPYSYPQPRSEESEEQPACTSAGSEAENTGEGEGEREGEGAGNSQVNCAPPQSAAKRAFNVSAQASKSAAGPRSPEYARVLERHLSRLVAKKNIVGALAVYRREIDHNPDDPGLYERLASFLDQNKLDAELEKTYQKAAQQFDDRSWYHRLARWYLRKDRTSDYSRLTQQVTKIFSGSDLEQYFNDGCCGTEQLYRELNLYAHQRFPRNLTFVRNLLTAHHTTKTYNDAAWWELLRQYWFYDAGLRSQFFERLSSTGRLNTELAKLRAMSPEAAGGQWDVVAASSPTAAQFAAEAEAWQSHFEAAGASMEALAARYPADSNLGRRASTLLRSLAYQGPGDTARAVNIEKRLADYDPGNRATFARIGDIYADRELFREAHPYWMRMAELEPGRPEGYLDSAAVFWDYFEFDDALSVIEAGRKKLAQPALCAYEAGALYEGKRDFAHALAEYQRGALTSRETNEARARLLALGRRPAYKQKVDEMTAQAASGASPADEAIFLRVDYLESQERRDDLAAFLSGLVAQTSSLDRLQILAQIAESQNLPTVRERVLERQAAKTADPIERMQLRLQLMHMLEGRKNIAGAQQLVEALYKENPKVLGIVRANVDFLWRNHQQAKAIAVLLEASRAAYPALAQQLQYEAARKSTDSGAYEQARSLLAALLANDAYNSEYLAAFADTYARAGDNAGLRDFYQSKIQLLRDARLPLDERNARIAGMRHGLILALIQLKEPAAALDQYIEIINRYPEDESLTSQAALYALRNNRKQQLTDYYARTAAAAPRDFRWPMVLAHLQTVNEDFPAAIDAYAAAIRIRPDRVDLATARASLEERLMRFDEAVSDYEKIYNLSYHNPQWMEKIAGLRARQGRTADVIEALRRALMEGRPDRASNEFEVAKRLEGWEMLPEARQFLETGMQKAGDELLTEPENIEGVRAYARVMTRLHEHQAAYERLQKALADLDAGNKSLLQKLMEAIQSGQGQSVEESTQKVRLEMRTGTARKSVSSALSQMGYVVNDYYTPEEKQALAAYTETLYSAMSPADRAQYLIPLVQAAGLWQQEVHWRYELAIARYKTTGTTEMARIADLQQRRMRFDELGAQQERFATLPNMQGYQNQAAQSYRMAGNTTAELRMLTKIRSASGPEQDRNFQLLLQSQPSRLVEIAGVHDPNNHRDDNAVAYTVSHANSALAASAVAARGANINPAWTRAYTGLVGLYFADASPRFDAAFRGALGASSIGEQLSARPDRAQVLTGDVWFYYGTGYGEYLGVTRRPEPEDYLPALLEKTPGRPAAYAELAAWYEESGDAARAITDYEHSLELSPDQPRIVDSIAMLMWKQGNKAGATDRWKAALAMLERQERDSLHIPPSFWSDVPVVVQHIAGRGLMPQMHAEVDRLLRYYIRINGAYEALPLLRSAYKSSTDAGAGASWILDLSTAARQPADVLEGVVAAPWVPDAQRGRIYDRLLELARGKVAKSGPNDIENDKAALRNLEVRRITWLVESRQTDLAKSTLDSWPVDDRRNSLNELAPLELRIAAQNNTLDALLDRYRAQPEAEPSLEVIRNTASTLENQGDKPSSQKLLEYLYTRQLENHDFSPGVFLGLAELRLQAGDLTSALALLERMTLVAGEPFTQLEPAAALLEKTGHPAEAASFRERLVKATPWDAAARLRLDQSRLKTAADKTATVNDFVQIATSRVARYETRSQAALSLAPATAAAPLSSAELNLLAGSAIAPESAQKPYFHAARMKAATQASGAARIRLLRSLLEDFPYDDAARYQLSLAAFDARQPQLILATMLPLESSFRYYGGYGGGQPADEESDDPEYSREQEYAEQAGVRGYSSYAGTGASSYTVQQRITIITALAWAYTQLDQLDAGARFYQQAVTLEKDSARRSDLRKKLVAVNSGIRRKNRNQGRMPAIHEALEQDHWVKPRLGPAAAKAPPKRTAQPVANEKRGAA